MSKHRVPVFVTDYDGSIINSILPPAAIKADLRNSQMRAASDPKKKFTISRAFVKAKIERSLQLLEWLEQRYDVAKEVRLTKREAARISDAADVPRLRAVEGRVALRYWETVRTTLPEALDFQGRMTSSHQNNASDPINVALNYGYGFLEGECLRAINSVGLEPAIGFLHDVSNYQTKQSLVYDLQEPFRWLIDLTVIQAFESGVLDLPDFFAGDDYRYRFEAGAKQRFIEGLRERFNSGVNYKGRVLKWDTVIEEKALELSRFLIGKSKTLRFEEPSPELKRDDDREFRRRILSLTQSQALELGIGKSTFHYLRQRAIATTSLKAYGPVLAKLTR